MNKCETCRANGICDHNRFGFETCGNYIPEWISVEDRLPKNNNEVLVCAYNSKRKFSTVFIDEYDEYDEYGRWAELRRHYNENIWSITHWMPLPEPPKGE